MVLADKTLFVAGPTDDGFRTIDALQGKKGSALLAVSVTDGGKLSELKLDSPPVFDGMAAANGRLYLVTQDGAVRCFGK